MKVPVVHVRGLILLFFSHWAHTEIYDSRRALYDDFSVSRHLHQIIIRCIRGAEKAFRRPYKLPLRTVFCPLDGLRHTGIDVSISESILQYRNRPCLTGTSALAVPESTL